MPEIRDRQAGFTLVETVVVILLLGILSAGAFYGILSGVEIYLTATRGFLNPFQEGRTALEKMAREIRETNPGSVTIAGGEVSFSKQSDHITPLDASENIRFFQSGTEIRREGDLSGTRVLAARIQAGSFSPSQDSRGVVTLSFNIAGDKAPIPLETAILPRVPDPDE